MPPEAEATTELTAAESSATAPPDVEGPTAAPEPSAAEQYEGKLANLTAQSRGLQVEVTKHMNVAKAAQTELEELRARVKADEDELQSDTLAFLKRKGRGYGDLTSELLKSEEAPLTPEQEQIKELLADKAARDERDAKTAEEAQAAEVERLREGNLSTIRDYFAEKGVEEPTGAYAYSSILGQEETFLSEAARFVEENHQNPSPEWQEQTALEIEADVRKRTHAELGKLLEADKSGSFREFLNGLLASSNPDTPADGQATTRRKGQGNNAKTLTQRSTSSPGPRERERLTEEQRMERLHKRLDDEGLLMPRQ
jgi:hypothetical protein|tara:strand:+ start:6339 stop:7277 length:939 start_codon:yes stop_codon:yes gene_type:complete